MAIGGNPLSFGQADASAIPSVNLAEPLPAPKVPSFLGVPTDLFGSSFFEAQQRLGLTSPIVDAGMVWAKNSIAKEPRTSWRTGREIMDSYPDLPMKLGQTDRLSPEAEAYVVQSASDSAYRQSIIQGNAAAHPLWSTAGSLLGTLSDPIFVGADLLTGGISGLASGAVGSTAATRFLLRAGLPFNRTLARGAMAARALDAPLAGLWGSRFVTGAARGGAAIGAAELLSQPFNEPSGIPEADPSSTLLNVLGGAVVGGTLHAVFGKLGDMGLNSKSPRLQKAVMEAVNDYTNQKAAGGAPDAEAILGKHLAPHLDEIGSLKDIIENGKPPEDLTPEEATVEESPAETPPEAATPPEAPAETPPALAPEVQTGEPKLPADLSKSKPRYNYGKKGYDNLTFESDIDKALFIVAQDSASKRNADFMAFLKKHLPALSEDEIKALGKRLRTEVIKPLAKEGEGGKLEIPQSYDRLHEAKTPHEVAITETADAVEQHPAVDLVATPEEKAILRAKTDQDLGDLVGDQVQKLRDTVVKYGEMVQNALDNGGLESDNAEFRSNRNRANGAITSIRRALGENITADAGTLLKDLSEIVKDISSRDPEKLAAAREKLGALDVQSVKDGTLSIQDLHNQIEALRAEQAKAEGQLKRNLKEATVAKYQKRLAEIEKDLASLVKQVGSLGGETTGFGFERTLSPNLETLAEKLGVKDKVSGQRLAFAKEQVLSAIASRARKLNDWQLSLNPLTGDIANPEAKLLSEYNEQLAGGSVKTPKDFLEEQAKSLDAAFQAAKSLPDWKETEFGKGTLERLEKLEEDHKAAMEKAKAYEDGSKQAYICGLQGELNNGA